MPMMPMMPDMPRMPERPLVPMTPRPPLPPDGRVLMRTAPQRLELGSPLRDRVVRVRSMGVTI
jgi:hypothetical protein